MAKPIVFVSHSSLDTAFASKLVSDLNAAGAQAWMDSNDLGPGNFQQRISEALAECEWFLLVLTPSALVSDWVRMEVDAAIRLKHQMRIRELIFIQATDVDQSEIPALWGVFNIFDATTDYKAALMKTVKALGVPSLANNSPTMPASVENAVVASGPPRNIRGLSKIAELEARLGLASHLLSIGEYADALAKFDDVLTVIESAVLEFRTGGFDAAFIQAIFGSYYSQAWRGKSMALNKLGRFMEAMKATRIAAKGLPL